MTRNSIRVVCVIALSLMITSVPSRAQTSSALRATELAHSFDKSKHKVRSKHGVRVEKFKDVVVEPRTTSAPQELSGSYADQTGLDAALDLVIDATGRGTGRGRDPVSDSNRDARSFTLENVRVDGALLTATKRYQGGSTEPFEAVLATRRDREHPDSAFTETVGIGVKLYRPLRIGGSVNVQRVFLRRTER